MKRLCLLSPDVEHARGVVRDLKEAGFAEKHIYAIAKSGTMLEGLPDAGPEADDFLPAFERGIALGGATGLLAGAAFPNSRLKSFEKEIEAGKILVMVDVLRNQLDEVTDMIELLDPAVEIEGIGPPAPLIPR